jgi:hypothetical protein
VGRNVTKNKVDMSFVNTKWNVWIIAVEAETSRYTPAYTTMKEAKDLGCRVFFSYEECLTVCQNKNELEGRYESPHSERGEM